MTQRFITFLTTFLWLTTLGLHNVAIAADTSEKNSKRTPEQAFLNGLDCLKQDNLDCATIAHVSIPPQSIYAKILEANIAAKQNDDEKVLQLLLPINASQVLNREPIIAEAVLSVHTQLAVVFSKQGNAAQSLEQYMLAETYLLSRQDLRLDAFEHNQLSLMNMLNAISLETLIQLRGEVEDTTAQGWVDLAIAGQRLNQNVMSLELWRKAYPDHPASQKTLASIQQQPSTQQAKGNAIFGKIALILPLQNTTYYQVADAIERGFTAAKTIDQDNSEVALYPSNANQAEILSLYERAIQEGAKFVVGPLTRDEVSTLKQTKAPVPTILLNQADNESQASANNALFFSLSLSIEAEAAQLVEYATKAGMQTARIVAEDTNIMSMLMTKAFSERWLASGGKLLSTTNLSDEAALNTIKTTITAEPSDMLLIAGNHSFAKKVMPHLGSTTPTFGFSHIFSGINADPEDTSLNAIQFVDIPWVLNPNDAQFKSYQAAAQNLPLGQLQRWFALGADAYTLLKHIAKDTKQIPYFEGLTGSIRLDNKGQVQRKLPLARFTQQGIVLESKP